MTFVQARSKLSEIVDRVAESGDTYVVSKRQKPRAGIATAVGDIDEAIRELRKSRIAAVIKKLP